MKLVGATKWFIIKPFLGRGALQGFVAGVIAVVLFAGVLFGFDYLLPTFDFMSQIEQISIIAASMVVVGVVVVSLLTFVTVNKCVNMRSNKLYLY
jgi:cell division transport system permease protein